MIHYTLLDPEIIWVDPRENQLVLEEKRIEGMHLVLRRLDFHSWQVEQILSTNPQDFLHPRYQPGTRINFWAGSK